MEQYCFGQGIFFKATELGPHDENRNFVMHFEMGKNKMSDKF